MDWFLYDRDLRHERVKCCPCIKTIYVVNLKVRHFSLELDSSAYEWKYIVQEVIKARGIFKTLSNI